MNIFILYSDSFILGIDSWLASLYQSQYFDSISLQNCIRETMRIENDRAKEMARDLNEKGVVSDQHVNFLISEKLEETESENVLIRGFPKSKNQYDHLNHLIAGHGDWKIKGVWYLEAVNVLNNIKLNDRFYRRAMSENNNLDHIKTAIRNSQRVNGLAFDFFTNAYKIKIDAFGIETNFSILRASKQIESVLFSE